MAKVSIIIPVYNGENYLQKSLESATNQTLSDIEILCINDCSKDNSLKKLEEYASKDSRIKIINSPINQGQSKSKNIAIKEANAEYILFLDQDDWLDKQTCELTYNQAITNNNDIVLFDFNFYYEDKNKYLQEKIQIEAFKEYYDYAQITLKDLNHDYFRSGWSWRCLYKKSLILENNIVFPEVNGFVDDVPFFFKSLINTNNISIINKPLYTHWENKKSTTYLHPELWYEIFDSREDVLNYILSSPQYKSFIKPFLIYYIRTIMYWFDEYEKKQISKNIKPQFYKKMQEAFIKINSQFTLNDIEEYIDYHSYKQILKYNYKTYCIKTFFEQIFSVYKKITPFGEHFRITILGIHLSIRNKGKKNK